MTGPAAGPGRPLSRLQAWALTRAVSPRSLVRVADVDAYGKAVNTYTAQFSRGWPSPQGSGGQTGNRVMAWL